MFVLINVTFLKKKAYLFSDYDVFDDSRMHYYNTAWSDEIVSQQRERVRSCDGNNAVLMRSFKQPGLSGSMILD